MAILFQDTFTRADSPTITGTSDSGHAWSKTGPTTKWGILSGQLYSSGTFSITAPIVCFPGKTDNISIEITISTLSAMRIFWRFNDGTNHFYVDNSNRVWEVVDSIATQKGTLSTSLLTGSVLKIELTGTTHKLYVSGVLAFTFTSTFNTDGLSFGVSASSATAKFDNVLIQDFTGGGGGTIVDGGTIAIDGSTNLTPNGNLLVGGTSTIDGSANLTPDGGVLRSGDLTINGATNLSVELTNITGTSLTVSISAQGDLTPNGSLILGNASTIDSTLNLTIIGGVIMDIPATISADGNITPNGGVILGGLSDISANTTLSSLEEVLSITVPSAILGAETTISVQGTNILGNDSTINASSSLGIEVGLLNGGSVTLSDNMNLTAIPIYLKESGSFLSIDTEMVINLVRQMNIEGDLSSSTSLNATGFTYIGTTLDLSALSNLNSSGTVELNGGSVISANTHLTAILTIVSLSTKLIGIVSFKTLDIKTDIKTNKAIVKAKSIKVDTDIRLKKVDTKLKVRRVDTNVL